MFPSLREIDLTNSFAVDGVAAAILQNCPFLEKFTYNTSRGHEELVSVVRYSEYNRALTPLYPESSVDTLYHLYFDGRAMKATHNLEEIIMDGSVLYTDYSQSGYQPNKILLQECGSKVLERVSMRNTKMYVLDPMLTFFEALSEGTEIFDMPQNVLIEFIRNAPTTLRWFRSNLTAANIEIVQHERPEIEFVS